MCHHMGFAELKKKECGYCLVIASILFFLRWEVLSWAVILAAKSKRGDCETALAPLLGFLIGFVIVDLCRVKAARENPGFGLYKIPSSLRWPSSLGLSVHSCSLLRRWPGFDPPPRASPSGHHPLTTVAATHPPYPLLSSQRSFFPVPIRLAQWGAVNSLRSANFQDGMPTPLSEARSGTPASTSHLKWESCSGGCGVSLRRIYYFRFWHCSIWCVYQQWALVRNCPVDQPQTKESSCCRLTLNDEGAGFGGSGSDV